ncbi:12774_t:CDS:10, partial [Acaulospora morrowiae]
ALQGDTSEAHELYQEGVELEKGSIFGNMALSWFNHDIKNYDSALEYAKKGRDLTNKYNKKTGSKLDRVLRSFELCMANCYLNIGAKFHDEAMSIYQKIRQKDCNNMMALHGIGKILSARGKFEESIKVFEEALELDTRDHISKSELAWIYFLLENYEEAIQLISEAIEICDGSALYHYQTSINDFAYVPLDHNSTGENRRDKKYAYSQFISSLKLDVQFSKSFTYLGHYYRLIEKNPVKAKSCYQKAISIDAQDEEAGTQLGEFYRSSGEKDLALGIYHAAIQANPRAGWALRQLGFFKLADGNNAEAITDLQDALKIDAKDVSCWEGLADAYMREGRYTSSMKAFARAIELDPSSVYAHFQIANIKQKLGMFDESIDQYKLTIEKARLKGDQSHLPSAKGIGDCYLASAKEYFYSGFYGRAAELLADGLLIMDQTVKEYHEHICLWKLIGDLCMTATLLPNYLHLMPLDSIKNLIGISRRLDLDEKLHLHKETDKFGLNLCENSDADNILNLDLILVLLTCGCFAYKYAIVLGGNRPDTAPPLWYDLGITYYKIFESYSRKDEASDSLLSSGYINAAVKCTKMALKFEPTNSNFWNALGIITISVNAKISQHAFIKAIKYSPKNPMIWANLGFLYLIHSDLELANQAFLNSRSLDPDYPLAWVGLAHVANLWGTDEAPGLFEHAYEISGGHVLDADYGFASLAFSQYKKSSTFHKSSLISPLFALKKLVEQDSNDSASLNLLGLLYEWLDQPQKSAESFNGAIMALEQKIRQLEQLASVQYDEGDDEKNLLSSKLNPFIKKLAYVQGNLGRVLCGAGDFDQSIKAYIEALNLIERQEDSESLSMMSFRIYTILGAGLAYYFSDDLVNSLKMFEDALEKTEGAMQMLEQKRSSDDIYGIGEVRKDVAVLLSQVLWALEGEEQRQMAREELFKCIEENTNHLPAMFGLCAMGLLQDDQTLIEATLTAMNNLPIKITDKLDRNRDVNFLRSRYFLLQGSIEEATDSLSKAVLLKPHDLINWTSLSSLLVSTTTPVASVSISSTALELISNPRSSAAKNLQIEE